MTAPYDHEAQPPKDTVKVPCDSCAVGWHEFDIDQVGLFVDRDGGSVVYRCPTMRTLQEHPLGPHPSISPEVFISRLTAAGVRWTDLRVLEMTL